MTLRIGLVGPVPPPAGGMAVQTAMLAANLHGEGLAVSLVPTNAPYRPGWIGRWRGIRALFRFLPYLWALWRLAGRSQLVHLMANSGWSWHLYAAPAIWICRVRGVPVIVNYRGGEAASFLAAAARWVLPTLARASLLVVPSGFLREVFDRFGVHAEVIPNAVDLSMFHPGARASAPVVIVTRNLEPIYDIATALRAMVRVRREVTSARIVIAGSGPQQAELVALAGSLGIGEAVEFAGRLDREELAARLRSSWVCLNPSVVDNMPNSLLEAMASEVPIVSTRVGGVPYIVEDGVSALLVPPRDDDAMARAIVRLIKEPQLGDRLRDAARGGVRAYTWQVVGPQWLRTYRRLALP